MHENEETGRKKEEIAVSMCIMLRLSSTSTIKYLRNISLIFYVLYFIKLSNVYPSAAPVLLFTRPLSFSEVQFLSLQLTSGLWSGAG